MAAFLEKVLDKALAAKALIADLGEEFGVNTRGLCCEPPFWASVRQKYGRARIRWIVFKLMVATAVYVVRGAKDHQRTLSIRRSRCIASRVKSTMLHLVHNHMLPIESENVIGRIHQFANDLERSHSDLPQILALVKTLQRFRGRGTSPGIKLALQQRFKSAK